MAIFSDSRLGYDVVAIAAVRRFDKPTFDRVLTLKLGQLWELACLR